MTRREAIEILKPERLSDDYTGGVYGCPCGKLLYNDRYFYFDMKIVEVCPGNCTRCWDEKLSIQESAALLSAAGVDVIREYLRKKRNEPVQKQVGKP